MNSTVHSQTNTKSSEKVTTNCRLFIAWRASFTRIGFSRSPARSKSVSNCSQAAAQRSAGAGTGAEASASLGGAAGRSTAVIISSLHRSAGHGHEHILQRLAGAAELGDGKIGEHDFAQESHFGVLLSLVSEADQLTVGLNVRDVAALTEPQGQCRRAAKHADLHFAVRLLLLLDFGNRADRQQLPALDDPHFVAHLGQLSEDVRAD